MRKLVFLIVILGVIALSVSCQSGLSEEEIRSIAHKEVIAEVSHQRTTIGQLEAEVAQLKAQNGELTRRVMTLEGELQLGKVADTEECLGEIARYLDNLYWYNKGISTYQDSLYRYLKGRTSFLWMPPPEPPSWSSIHCFKFE